MAKFVLVLLVLINYIQNITAWLKVEDLIVLPAGMRWLNICGGEDTAFINKEN